MQEEEKLRFFDENIESIFKVESEDLLEFIIESIDDPRILEAIKKWPNDIKIKVVEKHLIATDILPKEQTKESSWSEYYEMYDGKFDEMHMLHITIDAHFKNQIEDLGYTYQKEEDDWHKPQAGEYKKDDEGNLIIIHSCPDREIFSVEIKQFIEELTLKNEWVLYTSLTIM